MLSFELRQPEKLDAYEELEIYLDKDGLDDLLAQLQFLKDNRTDHLHLMSETWGLGDLDDQPWVAVNVPLRHVRISRTDSEYTPRVNA